MRIIFTCYAIVLAATCFIITLVLAFLHDTDERVYKMIVIATAFVLTIYGPVMFVLSILGWAFIDTIKY